MVSALSAAMPGDRLPDEDVSKVVGRRVLFSPLLFLRPTPHELLNFEGWRRTQPTIAGIEDNQVLRVLHRSRRLCT